jgi:hypothetical protein
MLRRLPLFAFAFWLASPMGVAQSNDYIRIARLSYLEGNVSFRHTDDFDWTAANINLALQPGDRIYTGENGRAEIEFDDGSVLRLAEKTDLEFLAMEEQLIQARILLGLCSLSARSSLPFEIDTPAAAFTTLERGNYRFDIAETGDADGIVRIGAMDAVNNRVSRRIESGEVLHVPAAENATEILARYEQRDAWDEWTDRRDADLMAYETRRYVPDTVYVGVSDLDRYGRWVDVDVYGPAWIPSVSVGWSPYWDGRWCYRSGWGWTWVSYEPWGWLPYHYGRWYHSVSFGWCWLPGPSFGFHFWSPGLVRFYRGPNSVYWCPLGPGDYYNVNNYYFNRTYAYQLNNMRLLQRRGPEDLANRGVPGAFRGVRSDHFINGGPGGRAEGLANPLNSLRDGHIVTGNLDIRPGMRSYAPAPDRPAARPANTASRAVVVRSEPKIQSSGDRYVRVTDPGIPVRGVRQNTPAGNNVNRVAPSPARSVQASGAVSNSTATGRNSGSAAVSNDSRVRVYQVPQSRAIQNNPGRSTQQNASGRQDTVTRSSQPPAATRTAPDTSARRVETARPGSSQGTDRNSVNTRSQPSRTTVTPGRSDNTRTPPATAKPATTRPATPVKKEPVKKSTSSYMPRVYVAPIGQASRAPAQAPSMTTGSANRSLSTGISRSVPNSTSSRGSYTGTVRAPVYRSAPQASRSQSSRSTSISIPQASRSQSISRSRMSIPQAGRSQSISRPQMSIPQASRSRSVARPQAGRSSSGSQAAGRKKR